MSLTLVGLERAGWKDDSDGNRGYFADYRLKATTPPTSTDNPVAVRSAVGIAIGATLSYDAGVKVVSVNGSCSQRRDVAGGAYWDWLVAVEWRSDYGKAGGGSSGEGGEEPTDEPDPTQRPTKISVTQEYKELALGLDINGDPIQNSAEDAFPLQHRLVRNVVTLDKYYTEWDFRRGRDYREDSNGYANTRNSLPFTILQAPWKNFEIAAGRGLMKSITPDVSRENGTVYALVKFVIVEDWSNHAEQVLDVGLTEFRGAPATKQPIMQAGVPVQSPVLLDGLGHEIDPTVTDPVTLEFQLHYERDWSLFNLP